MKIVTIKQSTTKLGTSLVDIDNKNKNMFVSMFIFEVSFNCQFFFLSELSFEKEYSSL